MKLDLRNDRDSSIKRLTVYWLEIKTKLAWIEKKNAWQMLLGLIRSLFLYQVNTVLFSILLLNTIKGA